MGNKNWMIWSGAALCMLLVLGAMGIVTQRFLDEKNQDVKQGTDAYRGERMRLAMWRLDTLATSIVGSEDARPAEALYTQDYKEIHKYLIDENEPVPDYYQNPPAHSNLYWGVDLDTTIKSAKSPQVFDNEYLVEKKIPTDYNTVNKENLDKFNTLLEQSVQAVESSSKAESNLVAVCVAVHALPFIEREKAKGQDTIVVANDTDELTLSSLSAQLPSQNDAYEGLRYKNAPEVQQKISRNSKSKRRQAVNRLADNYTKGQWSSNEISKAISKKVDKKEPVYALKVTPFSPVWLNDELVLARRLMRGGTISIQGVWLNKAEVTQQLLAEISDLFPNASLLALRGDSAADSSENAMVKLPFILVPGEGDYMSTVQFIEVFDGPIGLAWLGALLALVAGFFMLRSVLKMSERRAAFVSSVTHELRTPLTTFRLYSDMLSSGLVKDENARQTYLETLKRESERLTHLVENVLSYSQIERGSARAKVETVPLHSLIDRFEARLSSRAEEEGMRVEIDQPDEMLGIKVSVDTTAVEQVVFNLVDNAAKYASGENCGDLISIRAGVERGYLRIAVCDQGLGISNKELKRLFRPFHKSVEQAASSKPGVGLGLALCRRLARAMAGDLVYEKVEKGACFVLKIPNRGS